MNPADYAPIPAEEIALFQAELDAAGEQLREVLGDNPEADSPAIPFYLDGAAFLEIGYLMIEQLASNFPQVYRTLHQHHYDPLFKELRKGRMMWGEALAELPEFLKEYAEDKVQTELAGDDEDED